jgi:outer membrane protein assembly factor BamE
MLFRILAITIAVSLSACSSWVFRIDLPQGNFLEQKNIDKLQIGMNKEQVKFLLGSAVVQDAFNNDTWHYVYLMKSGRSEDLNVKKKFILHFEEELLTSAEGDFPLGDNFYVPMVN